MCRACGAPLIFIKTIGGKSIPCNTEQVRYKKVSGGTQKIVLPTGEVISGELAKLEDVEGVGYISHFATCSNPDFFRKARKSDRKKG